MCWYKNAGVAGYAEAFRPVQSDSQTSEWYSYFENDVLVIYPVAKECMNNCTFGERDSIMLLFTHRYPARCFGMNVPKSRDIQAKILLPQAIWNEFWLSYCERSEQ